MTFQQPTIVHHAFPWWLELAGAAIVGAALLFGALLVAGHSDLIPSTSQQGAAVAQGQYDSPALRNGEVLAPVARPQYDSPALRGVAPVIRSAATTTTSTETAESLRKEHLGIAPALVVRSAASTSLDTADSLRKEHLGIAPPTVPPQAP